MRLISWNVNGIRAAMKKGFLEFVTEQDPDILCIQETKMQEGQAEVPLEGYHQYWYSAEKKGYSGTAVFTKAEPLSSASCTCAICLLYMICRRSSARISAGYFR